MIYEFMCFYITPGIRNTWIVKIYTKYKINTLLQVMYISDNDLSQTKKLEKKKIQMRTQSHNSVRRPNHKAKPNLIP